MTTKPSFSSLVLIARNQSQDILKAAHYIGSWLVDNNYTVWAPDHLCPHLHAQTHPFNKTSELTDIDLVLVVGGDGSLLEAASLALELNKPILGVNRGQLGFLADLLPDDTDTLTEILQGQYQEEQRLVMQVNFTDQNGQVHQELSLNDVVLSPGTSARMIHFDIFVNNNFMCKQKADGVIVSTPTGSTAYNLSVGGPIVHPSLHSLVVTPMAPHNLSSRPVVVDAQDPILIQLHDRHSTSPCISCDGRESSSLAPNASFTILPSTHKLRLIHPQDYSFYNTLRYKLGWESQH